MHANEVVSVHDRVDETVQDDCEVNVPIVEHIRVEPVKEEDGDVVIDVQERKLSPFLSENNENGIPEIPNFGDIE